LRLNGKGGLNGISIDPSLMRDGEGKVLEDLIVAAHNDAKVKVEAVMAEKTKAMTAGLPLPSGFKLPF
jgi:nucleoid-associated protein EbfC